MENNNIRTLTNDEKDNLVHKIIHVFEFTLGRYNITLPNSEKEKHIDRLSSDGKYTVKAANIYGSDYRHMRDRIIQILEDEGLIKKGNINEENSKATD